MPTRVHVIAVHDDGHEPAGDLAREAIRSGVGFNFRPKTVKDDFPKPSIASYRAACKLMDWLKPQALYLPTPRRD